MQKALLEAYKELCNTVHNSSPYKALRGPFAKWYSIFNNGIQKFSMELNGVMIRTLDENLTITNIPWALTKIPGGSMDSDKLCSQLLLQIQCVIKVEPTAESQFLKKQQILEPDVIHPVPPTLFRCCKLESVDFDKKDIQLCFENWPVALVGDGCSVNKKAGEQLTTEIGLLSPTTRCSGHAATGSIKRMPSSETMSVPEVVIFAGVLRPILKHFQWRGKSTALLNDALLAMEMKPLKAMQCSQVGPYFRQKSLLGTF